MNDEVARALPTTSQFVASIGPTPLVPIQIGECRHPVWCMLEFMNPSGSTKDRVAAHILLKALREGTLRPGSTVVEAGSTSIAMALVCAQLGVWFVAVMPEGVGNERAQLIHAYGGEVERVDKDAGMQHCIERAGEVARECDGFLPDQSGNPENANAHRFPTGREIVGQIPGGVVHGVVAGVGTGGTLVGVTRGLKDAGCAPEVYAAKPLRRLHHLGFPVGPSSGLNVAAALQVAEDLGDESAVVTVLPDRIERYFSTGLLEDDASAETTSGTEGSCRSEDRGGTPPTHRPVMR